MNDTTQALDLIQPILRRELPDLQALYLFGSRVDGGDHPGSDLDLAVLLARGQRGDRPGLRLMAVRALCEEAIQRRVDLLDLRRADAVLRMQVLRGRRLICLDPVAVATFEMYAISLYQKLNQERRALLEQFQRTGRAYRC
ncbi:MAG: nucleotidyltransferase domain-containing protein [bacterium]|nr:nucleotidyltransferase domain-containing protein [bacterium]